MSKASELRRLKKLISQSVFKTDFLIPTFRIIKDEKIHECLVDADINLSKIQKQLKKLDISHWKNFISNKVISDEISDYLSQMQEAISKLVDSKIFDEYITKILNEFDKGIPFLIVRSSGEEDTIDNINAGGNDSIPFVKLEIASLKKAIIQVLTSYFSLESWQQRIQSFENWKDAKQAFLAEPNLECFVQQMIHEDDQHMVVSGNLISCEPCVATPDLCLIQAGYGFAAGTNPHIQVDRFYVHEQTVIFPEIYDKTFRQSYSEINNKTVTKFKSNPLDKITHSCLNRNEILLLSKIASFLKEEYKSEIEIEFVIQGTKIFLVQVRSYSLSLTPVVETIDPDTIQIVKQYSIKPLLSARSSLIFLEDRNQIIFANNEELAWKKYLKCENKSSIRLVVVGQMYSMISHPMVMFKRYAIPVAKGPTITTENNNKFIFDAQRNLLFVVSDKTYQQLTANNSPHILKKWHRHPVKMALSYDFFMLNNNLLSNEGIKDQKIKWRNWNFLNTVEKLVSASNSTKTIKELLSSYYQKTIGFMIKNKAILEADNQLFAVTKSVGLLLNIMLHLDYDRMTELSKLFWFNALESLLVQPLNPKSLKTFSFSEVKAYTSAIEELAVKIPNKNKSQYVILHSFQRFIFNEDSKSNYIVFLNKIISDNNSLNSFLILIKKLQLLNILPTWLNHTFQNSLENTGKFSQNSINDLEKNKDFVETINAFQQYIKLHEINLNINVTFNLLKFLKKESLSNNYKKAPALIKHLFIGLIDFFIYCMDFTIKQLIMKGSDENFIKIRIFIFVKVIKGIIAIFDLNIGKEILKELIDKFIKSNDLSLSENLNAEIVVASIIKNLPGSQDLPPYYPETLHDYFTTFHKLAIAVCSEAKKKININFKGSNNIEKIKNCVITAGNDIAENFRGNGAKDAIFLQQLILSRNFTVSYNIPLRHHGIVVRVSEDSRAKKFSINIRLFADNQNDRNQRIISFCHPILKAIFFDGNVICEAENMGVNINFKFSDNVRLDLINFLIYQVARISLTVDFDHGTAQKNIFDLTKNFLSIIPIEQSEKQQLAQIIIEENIENKTVHPLLSQAILLLHDGYFADSKLEECIPIIRSMGNDSRYTNDRYKLMTYIRVLSAITPRRLGYNLALNYINDFNDEINRCKYSYNQEILFYILALIINFIETWGKDENISKLNLSENFLFFREEYFRRSHNYSYNTTEENLRKNILYQINYILYLLNIIPASLYFRLNNNEVNYFEMNVKREVNVLFKHGDEEVLVNDWLYRLPNIFSKENVEYTYKNNSEDFISDLEKTLTIIIEKIKDDQQDLLFNKLLFLLSTSYFHNSTSINVQEFKFKKDLLILQIIQKFSHLSEINDDYENTTNEVDSPPFESTFIHKTIEKEIDLQWAYQSSTYEFSSILTPLIIHVLFTMKVRVDLELTIDNLSNISFLNEVIEKTPEKLVRDLLNKIIFNINLFISNNARLDKTIEAEYSLKYAFDFVELLCLKLCDKSTPSIPLIRLFKNIINCNSSPIVYTVVVDDYYQKIIVPAIQLCSSMIINKNTDPKVTTEFQYLFGSLLIYCENEFTKIGRDLDKGWKYPDATKQAQNTAIFLLQQLSELVNKQQKFIIKNLRFYNSIIQVLEKFITFVLDRRQPPDLKQIYESNIRKVAKDLKSQLESAYRDLESTKVIKDKGAFSVDSKSKKRRVRSEETSSSSEESSENSSSEYKTKKLKK